MHSLYSFLQELSRNFRIADLFDILIISLCVYSAIIWFRRTTSRSVVIGILLLTLVYFLARTFGLYLTSLLFQTFFAVLLVALVVVFQEEIRRAFERIAIWGTFRDRRRFATLPGIDTLLEGVSTMASNRIGALIVIKGREPLDRHVEGGIPLYGRVSKPLLYSIFDPHSPGHDGAVLIEGDRISKFGAHLPLSKNSFEIGMLGTRHAAGLGMSECSDAFVIIISEERGVISIAENGRIKPVQSIADLKSRLEQFYADRFRPEVATGWSGAFRQNGRMKVLSLVLASAAWFLMAHRAETIQRTFAVPIEQRNLPPGWDLEDPKPAMAKVTLTGSSRAFDLLNPSGLIISLDLSRIREGGQQVVLTEESMRRPPNLQVYRIEPSIIILTAYPMTAASLPVEVRTQGSLPPGLELVRVKVIPETVRVQLRKREPPAAESVSTEAIDLSEITQNTLLRAQLILPQDVRLMEQSPEVRVTLEVGPAAPTES